MRKLPDTERQNQTVHPDAEELVNLVRNVLEKTVSVIDRDGIGKRGPKSRNQILGWVDLEPYHLNRLKSAFLKQPKASAKTLEDIERLFSPVLGFDAKLMKATETGSIDWLKATNDVKLNYIHVHWSDVMANDVGFSRTLKRIVELLAELKAMLVKDQPLNSKDGTSKPNNSRAENNAGAKPQSITKPKLVTSIFLVLSTLVTGAWYLQFNGGAMRKPDPPPPKPSETYQMTDAEAKERLNTLWENGAAFAEQDQDVAYLETMSKARDLALSIFGPQSTEYAQAMNHMIGAFWTNGHHEKSIVSARIAYRIYMDRYGPLDERVLNDQVNLAARLSVSTSDVERIESRQLLFDALTKYQLLSKTRNVNFGMAHNYEAISIFHLDRDRPAEALVFSTRSVELIEQANVPDKINRAWIIANHAGVLRRAGDCESSKATFGRAIDAYETAKVSITQKDHAYSIREEQMNCGD